jgi:hypothetical protein
MGGIGGEQNAEEYGWLAVRIRSKREPDITDFTIIERFCGLGYGLGYGIGELPLVDESAWNPWHSSIIARLTIHADPR